MYKTIIMSTLQYEHDTLNLTAREEECKWRVSENKVLQILRPENYKETGAQEK
jgi:DNA-binding CsgD family transcriptional regulator